MCTYSQVIVHVYCALYVYVSVHVYICMCENVYINMYDRNEKKVRVS